MSTYTQFSDLKTDVENWSARSDFPTTVYGLATTRINRLLRVREMLSDWSATATAEAVTLPTDLLEFSLLYVDMDPRQMLTATDGAVSAFGYRSSGLPTEYYVDNDSLYLNPVPDGSYDLVGRYYARLDDMSADSDTNEILTKYPDVYLAASLASVYTWAQDAEALSYWEAMLSRAIDDANAFDRRARFAGPLRMRPGRVA